MTPFMVNARNSVFNEKGVGVSHPKIKFLLGFIWRRPCPKPETVTDWICCCISYITKEVLVYNFELNNLTKEEAHFRALDGITQEVKNFVVLVHLIIFKVLVIICIHIGYE